MQGVWHSFPIQLLFMHFRNNPILIGFWVFLCLAASGAIGKSHGVMHVLLDPEYLGNVGFLSFFWCGLSFSFFMMAWNVTTYVMNSHHFPFLASLTRPFSKYCLNNGIIPLAFTVFYFVCLYNFHTIYQFSTLNTVLWYQFGFVCGAATGLIGSSIYFYFTNHDIFSLLNSKELEHWKREFEIVRLALRNVDKNLRVLDSKFKRFNKNINHEFRKFKAPANRLTAFAEQRKREEAREVQNAPYREAWDVRFYLSFAMRPRRVREVHHYRAEWLIGVFQQNHFNAFVIQIASIFLILMLSLLIDYPAFMLPAMASGLLAFAMLISLTGALGYWLRGWYVIGLIFILWAVNWLTSLPFLQNYNMVYGIRYDTIMASLNYQRIDSLSSLAVYTQDKAATQVILDNWKKKIVATQKNTQKTKPKLVFICTSGGGMRAGVWTMKIMQTTDSLTNGELTKHTGLISGASGGMLGAAYYRELCLREKQGLLPQAAYSSSYRTFFSQDLLNPILFALSVNDIFVPWHKFKIHNQTYHKDRGYAFEQQLQKNTHNFLQKTVGDYRLPEQRADIPMLFVTPAIINDSRRLFISAQRVAYMTRPISAVRNTDLGDADGIDFGSFFHTQQGDSLRFTSALRMNATYPYILPNVHLPSQPTMEVMDAGITDNTGLQTTARFIDVFRTWIKQNTSGIVIVKIQDGERRDSLTGNPGGMISRFLSPLAFGTMFLNSQAFQEDNLINYLTEEFGSDKVTLLPFIYHSQRQNQRASLSFHLTRREYEDVMLSLQHPDNQKSLQSLVKILQNLPVVGKKK
jgi:hypothetical protein